MILYHVTQDFNHSGFFYPDIPKAVLKGENQHIPRVCTSKTIEGCLGSMPAGGLNLEETLAYKGDIFKVFQIDTERLNLVNIINDEDLYADRLVMDAEISKECWILEDFLVPEEDTFFMKVEDFLLDYVGYDNCFFHMEKDELGMTDEEFYNSDEYDPDDHTDNFGLIYNLDYRIIEKSDLDREIDEMKEELMIA